MIKKKSTLPRYPWDEWLLKKKDSITRLKKGKHFHCQAHSMQVQIRGAAYRRGIRVSLHTTTMKRVYPETVIAVTILGRKK